MPVKIRPALFALILSLCVGSVSAAGLQDARILRTVDVSSSASCGITVSTDGSQLLRSRVGGVEASDPLTGRVLWKRPIRTEGRCLTELKFSRDGTVLAGRDGLGADDLTAPERILLLDGHSGADRGSGEFDQSLSTYVLSKDGSGVYTAFPDGVTRFTRDGSKVSFRKPVLNGYRATRVLKIKRGVGVLGIVDYNGDAFLLRTQSVQAIRMLNTTDALELAFNPAKERMLISSSKGGMTLFATDTLKPMLTSKLRQYTMYALTYNAAGTMVFAGTKGGHLLMMTEAGTLLKDMQVSNGPVINVWCSEDGRHLFLESFTEQGTPGKRILTVIGTPGGAAIF